MEAEAFRCEAFRCGVLEGLVSTQGLKEEALWSAGEWAGPALKLSCMFFLVIIGSSPRSMMSVSASTIQLAPTVTAVPPSTITGHGDLQRARTLMSAKVGAWDQPLSIANGMGVDGSSVSYLEHWEYAFIAYVET